MIYDFYAQRDSEGKLEHRVDYELAVRNEQGGINIALQNKLNNDEDSRIDRNHRGQKRQITNDDAKNDAKKNALKTQKQYPEFIPALADRALPTPTSLRMIFSWQLATPFFSRGIAEFSAIDNPVSRDWLTQSPILHAAGAKGMLRGVYQQNESPENVLYLFGNDRDLKQPEDARAAVLIPDDVFFKGDTKNEIFSPHERDSRTVKLPVSFEMVPAGRPVEWSILCFDYTIDPARMTKLLPGVLKAVKELIEDFGMSAKRSSGYGIGKKLTVEFIPGEKLEFPLQKQVKFPITDAIQKLGGAQ